MCDSPMPDIRASAVWGSRATRSVRSSSTMRASALLILSRSAWLLGKTATVKHGSVKLIGCSAVVTSLLAASGAPARVLVSLARGEFEDRQYFCVAQFLAFQELFHHCVVALDGRLNQLFAIGADAVLDCSRDGDLLYFIAPLEGVGLLRYQVHHASEG